MLAGPLGPLRPLVEITDACGGRGWRWALEEQGLPCAEQHHQEEDEEGELCPHSTANDWAGGREGRAQPRA